MLILGILFFSFGCQSSQKEEGTSNEKFEWINTDEMVSRSFETVETDQVIEVTSSAANQVIQLSGLVADFQYIPLNNKESHLLGDIDKILFSDSLIFVMDQYITNSLQIFSRANGKELTYLEGSGEGPGEFSEIYDFDIDREAQIIYLFDGRLSKVLTFSFDGEYLQEYRVPLRAANFRKLASGDFVFYAANLPNDHLESISSCGYFVLNQSFQIEGCFDTKPVKKEFGIYYARDYFSTDGDDIYLFPRFEDYILQVDDKNGKLEKVLTVNLAGALQEDDFFGDGLSFLDDRAEDGKYYSHGANFFTSNWMGLSYKRVRNSAFYLFQNLENGTRLTGNRFGFDVKGMPFFSFPIASYQSEAAAVIKLQQVRDMGVEKFLTAMDAKDMKTPELEGFLTSISDFDQPSVLIFSLK